MVDLNALVAFDERDLDLNGDPMGTWTEAFRCRASIDYQRGSEAAISARLEGRQPAVIVVRDNPTTRSVTVAWRARIIEGRRVRPGEEFNIQSAAPAREMGFLNLLGVSGGAAG